MNARILVGVVGLVMAASVSFAQSAACSEKKEGASCSSGEKKACSSGDKVASGSCGSKSSCPGGGSAVAVNMPMVQYKVGDETVDCCARAKALANGDEAKIQFVVGEKTYAKQSEAMTAYAAVLRDYLGEMTTVKYGVGESCMTCPVSAAAVAKKENKAVEYRLASFAFKAEDSAKRAAADAKVAAEKVSMKWVVEGKDYCCSQMANDAAAKCESKKIEYVIGETKTECSIMAEVELMRAKIVAAGEVLTKAADSRIARG